MSLKDRNKRIGANIKYFRNSEGLSIRQLATKLGIPHSTLAKIERGEGTASKSILENICRNLEVSIEVLSGEDITKSVDTLVKYLLDNKTKHISQVLYWLSMSLDEAIRVDLLTTAYEHSSEDDHCYYSICYELGQLYEKKNPRKSAEFFKKAALKRC